MRTYKSYLEEMLFHLENICRENKECLASERRIRVRRKNRDTRIYHNDFVVVKEKGNGRSI